ncbi:MAG: hypothetical protein IJI19_06040 [Ruminococcus sp.]|nr:hypothetical protein [Ruminococcus sp.]
MSEAIITGLVAIAVCLVNNWFTMRATAKAQTDTITIINFKIQELTDKVSEHNKLIDRVYKVEKDTELQDAELKRVNERLKIVEGKG